MSLMEHLKQDYHLGMLKRHQKIDVRQKDCWDGANER